MVRSLWFAGRPFSGTDTPVLLGITTDDLAPARRSTRAVKDSKSPFVEFAVIETDQDDVVRTTSWPRVNPGRVTFKTSPDKMFTLLVNPNAIAEFAPTLGDSNSLLKEKLRDDSMK